MKTPKARISFHKSRYAVLAVSLLVAQGMFSSADAQNDLCIPVIGGLAGTPTIDGVIDGYSGPPVGAPTFDAGWNGAAQLNLSADLGSTTAARLLTGRDSSSVYLGFLVSTPMVNQDDTIVLTFSSDGTPAHDWRIEIQPFQSGQTDGMNLTPFAVTFWRDSSPPPTGWNTPGASGTTVNAGGVAPYSWLKDNVRFSKSGTQWSLEMKIPIVNDPTLLTGFSFPNSGTFNGQTHTPRMYVNVLSTSALLGSYSQDPWPGSALVSPVNGIPLEQNTPDPTVWGTVSFNDRPECTGVSIGWSDIGVDDPNNPGNLIQQIRRYTPSTTVAADAFPSTLAACQSLADDAYWNTPGPTGSTEKGPVNTFIAKPHNGQSGNAQVSATFRIAHWGVPGVQEWSPIGGGIPALGVANNPVPQQTISGGAGGNLSATWQLSYKWSAIFSLPTESHQCMQVELDSNDPNTRFKNKSVQKNMDFVPASKAERIALISGSQGPLPPGFSKHRIVLAVETDQLNLSKELASPGTNRVLSASGRARYAGIHSGEAISWAIANYLNTRGNYSSTNQNLAVWIARGYLRMGNSKLRINGRDYEYMKRIGDFGLVAGHTGPFYGWVFSLTGKGLKSYANGTVSEISVAPGAVAQLTTTIAACEAPPHRNCPFCATTSCAAIVAVVTGLALLGLVTNKSRRKKEPRSEKSPL